jgi:hypothetical protein
MKLYIAGPMSGIPQFNFPAFLAAAELLREQGFDVICPAEIDNEEDGGLAMESECGNLSETEKTWGDFLMRDVKIIADEADGVVLLPGWADSRGARLETFVAVQVQKPVFELEEMYQLTPSELMDVITFGTLHQGDVLRYKETDDEG